MPAFHVTYEIVTPESAEHGDAEERGFAMPGGWHYELQPGVCGPAAGKVKDEHALRLSEAVNMIGCVEGSDGDYYETDGRQDYRTGAETRYCLHAPRNITPASMARLERLLRARQLL